MKCPNCKKANASHAKFCHMCGAPFITAISNTTTLGTVSVSDYVITAKPNYNVGYASPAYEITNGTATVRKSGNTFFVTASTYCIIQINFEAIPPPPPPITITSVSNNTTLGTVIVSGNVITAIPNYRVGYASPAFEIIKGTAAVSKSGNTFIVTASINCTIQINFEVIITVISNKTTLGTVSVSGNVITAMPNYRVGYAKPAYEITDGTAKVWQSGNTFIVTASTGCTIQINFLKKRIPWYVVALVALCLIIVAFFVIKSLSSSDKPIKVADTENVIFDPQKLVGLYRAKIDGQYTTLSARIEKAISQDEYQIKIHRGIIINNMEKGITFSFTYCGGKNISSSDFTNGELDLDNLPHIKITFKKDNQLWILEDVLPL